MAIQTTFVCDVCGNEVRDEEGSVRPPEVRGGLANSLGSRPLGVFASELGSRPPPRIEDTARQVTVQVLTCDGRSRTQNPQTLYGRNVEICRRESCLVKAIQLSFETIKVKT